MASKKVIETAQEMEKILAKHNSFIVLDLETTGLSPNKGGRIIEIGAVKVENGVITDSFDQLVHPEMKIYGKTIELTGITNEMVADKPVYRQVLPKFYEFLGNHVVVAHNATFDWDRFLKHYLPMVGIVPENQVIDTLVMSKYYYEDAPAYKLGELCKYLGIELENAHRAVHDARATAKLLLKMKAEKMPEDVNSGQVDLFSMDNTEGKLPKSVVKPDNSFYIKRISHWEKTVSKKVRYERIYVMLNIGNVYFDIPTRTWGVQQSEGSLDLKAVSEKTVKELKEKTLKHAKALQALKGTTIDIDDLLMP